HYGVGQVSADFCGLARERRTQEEPGTLHIYFTGCAGNITAGKYNDGAPENRPILSERVYRAMVESEQNAEEIAAQALRWTVEPVHFTPRPDRSNAELLARVNDAERSTPDRCWAAFELAFRRRVAAGMPVLITGLHLGEKVCVLHLPGEALIEY